MSYPPVPSRSPYQLGDRVRLHGYPGYPAGPRQTGFVGQVAGGFGTNALWVAGDDGVTYVEPWTALTLDGELEKSAVPCSCCTSSAALLDYRGTARNADETEPAMIRPTTSQTAAIYYFATGQIQRVGTTGRKVRTTEATYRVCREQGWIEQVDAFPYHRATTAGRAAIGLLAAEPTAADLEEAYAANDAFDRTAEKVTAAMTVPVSGVKIGDIVTYAADVQFGDPKPRKIRIGAVYASGTFSGRFLDQATGRPDGFLLANLTRREILTADQTASPAAVERQLTFAMMTPRRQQGNVELDHAEALAESAARTLPGAEVEDEDEPECEGHESLSGAGGVSVFCDGSCVRI